MTRLWHQLLDVARLFRQAGQRIAGELRCGRCGSTRRCSARDAARYLEEGWPTCHGETMLLSSREAPGAARNVLSMPERAKRPRRF